MKLFGYACSELPLENIHPLALAEVTLNADPEELRAMAKFLADCADEMDRMGVAFDHVHLGDRMKNFRSSPHFVVVRN